MTAKGPWIRLYEDGATSIVCGADRCTMNAHAEPSSTETNILVTEAAYGGWVFSEKQDCWFCPSCSALYNNVGRRLKHG